MRRFEGDRRGRCDTESVNFDTLGRQAGHEGRLEHRRGHPTVATDDRDASLEHLGRSPTEVECERWGQFGVGPTANSIGTEAHGGPAAGALISAW